MLRTLCSATSVRLLPANRLVQTTPVPAQVMTISYSTCESTAGTYVVTITCASGSTTLSTGTLTLHVQ
jgi:hypothetical protein